MDYTLSQLIKLSKTDKSEFPTVKIAIVGNDATQHLKNSIAGMAVVNKINAEIFDADYNQLDFQIYDTSSELYCFEPEYVLLSMCVEKLYEEFADSASKKEFAQIQFDKLKGYYSNINANLKAKILQFTFIEENDRTFGNFGLILEDSFIYQVKKLNFMLMEYAYSLGNLFLIDTNDIRAKYGSDIFCDKKFYCNAKMSISPTVLPAVAKNVLDIIKAIRGVVKKCVILDLDNTLWGGVIGDDGMDGIELGELGIGHAFSELQLWLKGLKERGILLCVCSKNNEDTAKEPFISHPDMILHLEDIAMFVANWEDKATNIRYIQKTLNIGMDSIVFLDDNPFERNLVKEMIPDITVPDLPEDASLYTTYVKNLNLFETVSYSSNDSDRTAQYQQQVNRNELLKNSQNFDDYLIGLEMTGEAKTFEKYYYPRIAQLTQRSNQFNLRTIRYTEAEIANIASDDKYLTLYYTLKDRFGDNGLVAVVILEKLDSETVFINEWLMSCRVLKRGMEEFIVNEIFAAASAAGFKKVKGEYIKTKKNSMVEHIYDDFGFNKISNTEYEIEVADYKPRNHFIKKIDQ